MKITVFGATGRIGSRIVTEALNRGHEVTAAVRNPENFTGHEPHLGVIKADIFNSQDVATAAFDHDVVVSAYSNTHGAQPSTIVEVAVPLINGVKEAGVKRLFIVGGAGSLEVAPGLQLVDAPNFPQEYKATANAHRDALKVYQQEKDLEWTYLSPAIEIAPGERTGKYRTGADQVLFDEHGKSFISMEDYAIAVLDEIEDPKHSRARFTVAW
ncbi:MAG TPA: NAD(P)-dependent oxidoreductase [Mucilaginibacter sp.]|nr:NAD(P)-dependent oxidoreductase [Mucilaginibacter sp.]